MNADGKQFTVASNGTYVTEISQLQLAGVPNILHVEGLDGKPGVRSFGIVGTDRNGEDVAGWRYLEQGKSAKLLVIND
jgi:hypothetical protein